MDFAEAFETLNKLNESKATDEVVKLIQEIETLEQEIEDFETQVRLDWDNNYSKQLDTKRAELQQLRSELATVVDTYRKWFYTTDSYGETEKDFEDDSVKKAEVAEREENLEAKIKQCEKELNDLEAQLKAEQKQALSKEYQVNQDRKNSLDSKKALKKASKAAVLDTERDNIEKLLSKLRSDFKKYYSYPSIFLEKIEPIWNKFNINSTELYIPLAFTFSTEVDFYEIESDQDLDSEILKILDADFFEDFLTQLIFMMAPDDLDDEFIQEYLDFNLFVPFGDDGWEINSDSEDIEVEILNDVSEDQPEAKVECIIDLSKNL